jgi:hypothetical protein
VSTNYCLLLLAMRPVNHSMTKCTKTGIKIRNTGNDHAVDPFAGVDPFANRAREVERVDVQYSKTQYEAIDLNLDNYSRNELYSLFGFKASATLTEDNMKEAKKIVLKTHPDKSRLDNKYFLFFSKAYKKLLEIYEFQNKMQTNKAIIETYKERDENADVLDKMFEMKQELKDTKHFNSWFNAQFEKHRLNDPVDKGYGEWLKSDEDIVYTPQHINKDTMAREMEKHKKHVQTVSHYTGVNNSFLSSSVGGSSLMEYDSNFSSGSLFGSGGGYTDLRQAYAESVIPVTEEDFHRTQKFRTVEEYQRHRGNVDLTPLTKEEAMRQLFYQEKKDNDDSAALAFYYAQQSEKAKKNNDEFWSGLKQLTNW